ncbi:NUDIX hydrolase [Nonomuraea glycinis]|uniref:8-oxo-dGTP diphosphatase n=1 Tax=Nonomuraea glycinis TaxID=2047744 RepID=A0A918ADQ6_9ACTN|nr:NUDIX hydrolase [Nonomuraea glycinis]MCA2181410.1 NUDIX hydrolase [Nonomuraea glycinis]GGP14414.1 hypothetical protein GCM10012278_70120 [Nonomuraea glycinis]
MAVKTVLDQNVPMTISADDSGPVRIVTAVLRDGDRVLLCHRSAGRRWYPDVWDLPGGHVEEGEDPKESLVRELREELGITASEPSGPPMHEIRTATFDMQIWLIDRWTGTPVNAAPDEHDAVAWFKTPDLDSLRRISRCSPPCSSHDIAPEARGARSSADPDTTGARRTSLCLVVLAGADLRPRPADGPATVIASARAKLSDRLAGTSGVVRSSSEV